jgi:hypothetical protein
MDDELVTVLQSPAVEAAFLGRDWVDEFFEPGSRDHRCYTGLAILFDESPREWWTYYQAYVLPELNINARMPSADRLRRMRTKLEAIWRDLGLFNQP